MHDHPLMRSEPFQTEVQRLEWLVHFLQTRVAAGLKIVPYDIDDDLVHVTTSLVSHALHLARGVAILLGSDLTIAVGPLERTLYELWCETRGLLSQGEMGARKMLLNSMIELLDASKNDEGADFALKQMYQDMITFVESTFPEISETIRTQRRKRRFHWSGRSRTEIMGLGSPDAQLYRCLSWEGNFEHAALLDAVVHVLKKTSTTKSYPVGRPQWMSKEQVAFRCSVYLSDMWDRYFELLQLEPISWPKFI